MFFSCASAVWGRKDPILDPACWCQRCRGAKPVYVLPCWMLGSGDLMLSIPGVFQMPFSFSWLFWVPFEEGQQAERVPMH